MKQFGSVNQTCTYKCRKFITKIDVLIDGFWENSLFISHSDFSGRILRLQCKEIKEAGENSSKGIVFFDSRCYRVYFLPLAVKDASLELAKKNRQQGLCSIPIGFSRNRMFFAQQTKVNTDSAIGYKHV